MKRLSYLALIFCLATIIFIDKVSWSSSRFACYADIYDEHGKRIATDKVDLIIALPLPVVFWRKTGAATFELSNNKINVDAHQVDENYRIIFSDESNRDFDGYLYLITEKAEFKLDKSIYALECNLIDHN